MKHIYIAVLALFTLLSSACIKEGGNEFIPDLPAPQVTGFEKSYSAFTFRDALVISPEVERASQYDFAWTIVSNNYIVGSGVIPLGDTIARTKDLNYEIKLNPGQYLLALRIKNKQSGVTKIIPSTLNVSTLTMGGWYLLKDDGTKTDFDFIYPSGRIDNWIANFNGKGLQGKAIKSVYAGSFKKGLQSTDLYGAFAVISDQDAAILRIDNGKMVMSFEDMFFTKPAVKRPQNVLQPQADNNIHLINDGKVYTLSKGAFFSDPPASTYKMASVAAVGSLGMAFDDNSKSMVWLDGANYVALPASAGLLKNMNASVVWIGGYPGLRNAGLALFRKAAGEGLLVKMSLVYGSMTGSTFPGTPPLIADSKSVPTSHGLMSADAIGGNYDSDYIYYAKGNKIYVTDFASLPESLQVSLPAGETVTCIQHIKYPVPAAGVAQTVDYLAIASYAGGKYKVWLHPISSTGTISTLAQPTFQGDGKVACVNYVDQGRGNKTY
ncbi:PKD-like family lipoprotein [Pedobacter sp. GR22-6]|uniref:PKD-like family lipoprotein n=1 Tax=Pedobacter sp. GR22-6 TaxID=3127957 RepID=UPI00307FC1DC